MLPAESVPVVTTTVVALALVLGVMVEVKVLPAVSTPVVMTIMAAPVAAVEELGGALMVEVKVLPAESVPVVMTTVA